MGMSQLFPFQPYQNMLSLEDQVAAPAHLNDLTHIKSFSTVVLILIDLWCFANQTCVAVGTQVTYCYALTASGSNLYNITVRISAFISSLNIYSLTYNFLSLLTVFSSLVSRYWRLFYGTCDVCNFGRFRQHWVRRWSSIEIDMSRSIQLHPLYSDQCQFITFAVCWFLHGTFPTTIFSFTTLFHSFAKSWCFF